MESTLFRKLVAQIEVLCPMCQFHQAKILCQPDALFFRKRYDKLNVELNKLLVWSE